MSLGRIPNKAEPSTPGITSSSSQYKANEGWDEILKALEELQAEVIELKEARAYDDST